jgi:hypothetical protein
MPALLAPFDEWSLLRERRNEVQTTRTVSIAAWFSAMRWQSRKFVMLRRYGVPTVR